jgi:hypothetical protein
MSLVRLGYVWIDRYQPPTNIRTKARVFDADLFDRSIESGPICGFDGGSTKQDRTHPGPSS